MLVQCWWAEVGTLILGEVETTQADLQWVMAVVGHCSKMPGWGLAD